MKESVVKRQKVAMRLTTGWKIVLWTTALLAVWSLFVNPTIFDAILTFCLAGVVPGTNKVLSPNAVIAIVGGVLGFIVLLIVGIPIARRLIGQRKLGRERLPLTDDSSDGAQQPHRRLGGMVVGSLHETAQATSLEQKPEVVVVTTPERLPQKNPFFLRAITALVALRTRLQPLIKKIAPTLQQYAHVVGIIVRHESRNFKRFAKRVAVAAQKAAIIAAGWTATQLIAFWAWLKPYVNRFDAWLAKEFRPLKKRISKKARKNDTLMLLRDIAKGLLREVKPYSPVVLWGKFREEQQQTRERSLKDAE